MNDQQMFLFNLDINNIAASAGSACTSVQKLDLMFWLRSRKIKDMPQLDSHLAK